MAKVTGKIKPKGTIGNLTFYEMEGNTYVRMKSSLTGKRVKKDPAFRRTMEYAGWLKLSSKLASSCYREIPEEEKEHGMYREMVGMAMQMLKLGIEEDGIARCLAMASRKEESPAPRLYVDNTGHLRSLQFGNNLITLSPCHFQVILPKIPDTHEKIRGIHPVFFHTDIRRRKFLHGAEYH